MTLQANQAGKSYELLAKVPVHHNTYNAGAGVGATGVFAPADAVAASVVGHYKKTSDKVNSKDVYYSDDEDAWLYYDATIDAYVIVTLPPSDIATPEDYWCNGTSGSSTVEGNYTKVVVHWVADNTVIAVSADGDGNGLTAAYST